MNFKYLSSLFGTGLLASLVACSPANKGTLNVNKDSSSIIGGSAVELNDTIAKSTVALVAIVQMDDGSESQFICTGSLLTSNIVLTAGHCVPTVGGKVKQAGIFVVFNTDLKKIQKADIRPVTSYQLHPQYGQSGNDGEDANDVALVKFDGAMASGYQLAKFLDDESLLVPGTDVTLAGYGLTETDGVNTKSDDRLNKVVVQIAEDFGKTEVLLDQTKGKGACHGDSGGPAFINVKGTQYVWGITSRGAGKEGKDDCSLVSVYTKVKAQNEFISNALKILK